MMAYALLLWSGTAATVPNQIVPAMNGGGATFFPLRSGIVFAIKATMAGGIAPGNTLVVELAKMWQPTHPITLRSTSPPSTAPWTESASEAAVLSRLS
jgi:hypothetical protein